MSTIYKYQSFNINSLSSIINSELWFSLPRDFNDPLDCTINLKVVNFPDEHNSKSFYQAMQNEFPDTSLESKISAFKKDKTIFEEDYKRFFNLMSKKSIGIACFSKFSSHPLMWAHYTDGHSGFCLGFNREKLEKSFGKNVIYDVDYPVKRRPISVDANPENNMQIEFNPIPVFTSKYNFWRYEKEVRAILDFSSEKKSQLVKYNSEALTEVIFGIKMPEKEKMLLIKTIGNKNINFFNARINEATGKIEKDFIFIN
ncbi:MAG: DUF2971 domain-containing protein [Crocinitomicaceae bacterium]